jgi:hypothetical protein
MALPAIAAVGRFLAGAMSKKAAFGFVAAGVGIGLTKHGVQSLSPYISQGIRDSVGNSNLSNSITTNRQGWVGTKGAHAPLNATGDLALAAHRLRNKS